MADDEGDNCYDDVDGLDSVADIDSAGDAMS